MSQKPRPVLNRRPNLRREASRHRPTSVAVAERRSKFVHQFIVLRERGVAFPEAARQAAIYVGYSPASAPTAAHTILRDPKVIEAIDASMRNHMERAEINSATILRYWWDLATTELPLPPAGACRHCWGQDFQYQYTLAESRNALRKHTAEQLKKQPHNRVPFDELGGIGFDKRRPPHPDCPECNGEGRNYVMVIDRSKLTKAQRMAIDEVRVHKDGSVSLKMRDRTRAMENLQSLMGMIQPRKQLEVIDPARPIEENVDILLQTAIDQGLLEVNQPPLPIPTPPVIEHENANDAGTAAELAELDAA